VFLEPLYFVERCKQRPGSQRFAAFGIWDIGRQPQDSDASALGSLESEDRFESVSARASHMAGRSAIEIRLKTSRMGSADMRFQFSKNSVRAVDGPDMPSQGQYIAPMAIRMKQSLEQNVVGFR
jgi:hypothetical protein